MKQLILLFALFLMINSVKAQTELNYIQVDTSTYNAYLNGKWNRIIEVGEQAVDQEIDYYYLRLRIGYAYFMKNQYRQAISHYKQAIEFNQNDTIASEYLYYCYQYSGRGNDAQKLKGHFSSTLKNYVDHGKPKSSTELGLFFSHGNGPSDQYKKEQIAAAPTDTNGVQIMPNKFSNYTVNLSHKIGGSMKARHSVSALFKDEYALAVVNLTPYLSESQIVRQLNYHLALDITPFYGFTLTPIFSITNFRIPVFYEYGVGTESDRAVYGYISYSEKNLGLKARKQLGIFEAGLSIVRSNYNKSEQNTLGATLTVYPYGNLNLYYVGAFYKHDQEHNSDSETQYIQSHKIGVRVYKNLYLEGLALMGGFTNFYDSYSELTYNSVEKYNTVWGANLILPFQKSSTTLYLGYRNYNTESMFVPTNDVLNTLNNNEMNYQSITAGIIWKF